MVAFSRIEALDAADENRQSRPAARHFNHLVVTSIFGDPLQASTWSGAPRNLADALSRHGVAVIGVHPHIGQTAKMLCAARHLLGGYGPLRNAAQLLREEPARHSHARQVEEAIEQLGARHVLHTGTLDLPTLTLRDGVKHYLYCDHTWALARPFRATADGCSPRAMLEYERLELESLLRLDHIFTFGAYVRDHIVAHYGVPADRVTAVGSGMGGIKPYFGPKAYSEAGRMLFVAKHLFREKGGELLVEAFMSLRHHHPTLRLTIVGDERSRRFVPDCPEIEFRPRVTWTELQALFRDATLLVQPMLDDPWGQVFLEALASRTPVLGLNRNGLPEISGHGKYGFLVEQADPASVADTILEAMSDPDRLAWMGQEGQRYVLRHYSWDAVAARMLAVLARGDTRPS
jgi:glycosyltransferase involved in cell wall biosynthesis